MTLKEKLLDLETRLIGNRFSILGESLLLGGYGAFANEVLNNISRDNYSGIIPAIGFCGLAFVGACLTGYTEFGRTTKKIYRRTKEHLGKFGKLDKDFFSTCLKTEADKRYTGYCQLQGMYLACRDYAPELLPEFYQLKKQNTKNILPNF
ncbi:MAG: hypothetical protein WCI72_00355 [archaeon]